MLRADSSVTNAAFHQFSSKNVIPTQAVAPPWAQPRSGGIALQVGTTVQREHRARPAIPPLRERAKRRVRSGRDDDESTGAALNPLVQPVIEPEQDAVGDRGCDEEQE